MKIPTVVPHAGTWIEMLKTDVLSALPATVVPHAGTWIEIGFADAWNKNNVSFPTRERGLKFLFF